MRPLRPLERRAYHQNRILEPIFKRINYSIDFNQWKQRSHVEKTSAVHIVAVVVMDVAESTGMAASKNNHPT